MRITFKFLVFGLPLTSIGSRSLWCLAFISTPRWVGSCHSNRPKPVRLPSLSVPTTVSSVWFRKIASFAGSWSFIGSCATVHTVGFYVRMRVCWTNGPFVVWFRKRTVSPSLSSMLGSFTLTVSILYIFGAVISFLFSAFPFVFVQFS